MTNSCAALKEWAATCRALEAGRQIILLRKGGILDEDGSFHLEYPAFWLEPTFLHQSQAQVKPADRDLLDDIRAPDDKDLHLKHYAEVARVWALGPDDEDALRQARHIWSQSYLDIRFGYKPEKPLLCVALRVWTVPHAHRVVSKPEFFGCRSWLDLGAELSLESARPALDEAAFQEQLDELERVLPQNGRSITELTPK